MEQQFIQDVEKALFQRAVKFGEVPRYHNIKAWPFWYPFIPYPYLDTDSQNNGLGLMGFTIAAGAIQEIPVVLQPDVIYQLLDIKYNAYYDTGGGKYAWYETPAGYTPQPKATAQVRPLYTYLETSLIISSIKDTYVYGGLQYEGLTGLQERPLNIRTLQGFNSGKGVLRTPFQVPREATIKVKIRNNYTSSIVVNGVLFGYKVAI